MDWSSKLRRLATAIALVRLRRATSPKRTWRLFRHGEALGLLDADPSTIIVIALGQVPGIKGAASRLAAAMDRYHADFACGPTLVPTGEVRSPFRVEAAGFELGHDGTEGVLIPLLKDERPAPAWGAAVSWAPRPSGAVLGVRQGRLREVIGTELPPASDEVEAALATLGPWMVVWSAAHLWNGAPLPPPNDAAFVEERRHQGEGRVERLEGPSSEGPGNPAPDPGAIWVGTVSHRFQAGTDGAIMRPRVAIRHAATDWSVAKLWGDQHFAEALARSFAKRGIGARVAPHHAWSHPYAARDLVITLRGLRPVVPVSARVNVLWVISHPDEVTASELDGHDLIAVASAHDVERITSHTPKPVIPLLQATEWGRFHRPPRADGDEVVFVGNSRGVARESVSWAAAEGLDPLIYGSGWEALPCGARLLEPIDNVDVPERFHTAGVVLADHWEDMRTRGYVSNRIFDVIAAGGMPLSDPVVGLEDLFPGIAVYRTQEELGALARRWLNPASQSERIRVIKAWQQDVEKRHSFDVRVEELLAAISDLLPRGADLVRSLPDPEWSSEHDQENV